MEAVFSSLLGYEDLSCERCLDEDLLEVAFTFAFQPIVDFSKQRIVSHEALVRGPNGESAGWVLDQIDQSNIYRFDQACRTRAIALASQLDVDCGLNINFTPNAVYRPELCIRTTLAAADRFNFPVERIVLEVTESEKIEDHGHLRGIIEHYQARGFTAALDDFGAGHSGLALLATFQPDLIKVDMALVRDIDQDRVRQAIFRGIHQVCADLGIALLAEGVESRAEVDWLRDQGVDLFQGFYFAKPAYEALVPVDPDWFK